jgi:DNA (cytosine-5)-methyltransferase 1
VKASPDYRVCGAAPTRMELLKAVRRALGGHSSDSSPTSVRRFIKRYFGKGVDDDRVARGLSPVIDLYCHPAQPDCGHCALRYQCAFAETRKEVFQGHPTFADLFCGAGGLSLGFEQAGYIPKIAIDNDRWFVATYAYNRPNLRNTCQIVQADISTWLRHKPLPTAVDVVVGGVPCQPFSNANRQRRNDDPRHQLFRSFLEFVELSKPKVVLMENVSGFRAHNVEVIQYFRDLGYAVVPHMVDAVSFGLPQSRSRLVLLGFSQDHFTDAKDRALDTLDDLSARSLKTEGQTLRDAIADLPTLQAVRVPYAPEFESDETGHAMTWRVDLPASPYLTQIHHGKMPHFVYNHKARYNNDRDIKIFSLLKEGEDSRSPKIADIMPYKLREHIFVDKYFKLVYDRPSRTITAHMRYDCNTYIHPTQARGLTAREAARIQGFPDDYVFTGNFQRVYQQIGNAVPPPLAKIFASSILERLA